MKLEQTQSLAQKLVLTQNMRQSLDCLQLSAPELSEYVQEVALSNPLLDVQAPTYYETQFPSEAAPSEREAPEIREADAWQIALGYDYPLSKRTYLYAAASYVDRTYKENGKEVSRT